MVSWKEAGGEMPPILIVDYTLPAEALTGYLEQRGLRPLRAGPAELGRLAPPRALALIEVFLPGGQCGLQLAHCLRRSRPDLLLLPWTAAPDPFHLWAARQYNLPGFLDKEMAVSDLLDWLYRATLTGTAWPDELWAQAQRWETEVAVRLQGLTVDLWRLWAGVVRGLSNRDLAQWLAWSPRTVERRLSELYTALGVDRRPAAVRAAWQWHLVKALGQDLRWSAVVEDLFFVPNPLSDQR